MGESGGGTVLVDAHGSQVAPAVWGLYADVITRIGAVPTLIERDNRVPPLESLLAEAHQADRMQRSLLREPA